MYKNILLYLPSDISFSVLQEAQKNIASPTSKLFMVEILTFEEIFRKMPMNEELDVKEAQKKLALWGTALNVPHSHQFVKIGQPALNLIELIKKFQIELLITTTKKFNLGVSYRELIEQMICSIIEIQDY